jgi:hypothetical protein
LEEKLKKKGGARADVTASRSKVGARNPIQKENLKQKIDNKCPIESEENAHTSSSFEEEDSTYEENSDGSRGGSEDTSNSSNDEDGAEEEDCESPVEGDDENKIEYKEALEGGFASNNNAEENNNASPMDSESR